MYEDVFILSNTGNTSYEGPYEFSCMGRDGTAK